MKVLKITGDSEERGCWTNDDFEGYVIYDDDSNLVLGYICRNTEYSSSMTTSYVVGSYDIDTQELELLEVQPEHNGEDDNLFIFKDVREEGIWGKCDLKYDYFDVLGGARIRLEETDERRARDVERAAEYLEAEIDDIDAVLAISDYREMVHTKFSGILIAHFSS